MKGVKVRRRTDNVGGQPTNEFKYDQMNVISDFQYETMVALCDNPAFGLPKPKPLPRDAIYGDYKIYCRALRKKLQRIEYLRRTGATNA